MTPREEFKLCFGVARSRLSQEDGTPTYSGMPKRLLPALHTALDSYDPWERRQPLRILRILKQKRDPVSPRRLGPYNCRCTMRPIIVDEEKGS